MVLGLITVDEDHIIYVIKICGRIMFFAVKGKKLHVKFNQIIGKLNFALLKLFLAIFGILFYIWCMVFWQFGDAIIIFDIEFYYGLINIVSTFLWGYLLLNLVHSEMNLIIDGGNFRKDKQFPSWWQREENVYHETLIAISLRKREETNGFRREIEMKMMKGGSSE